MNLEKIFKDIIEKKHNELNLGRNYNQVFSKVKDFEGNAIGQIGETFLKLIISGITKIKIEGTIHNEYDIITESGKKIEVKTARKGSKNNTFQFNGINPKYNYDFIICLGICEDKLLYRIFSKTESKYIHNDRKEYIVQGDFKRQLVQMNPDNHVNFKLTISLSDLHTIDTLIAELTTLLL